MGTFFLIIAIILGLTVKLTDSGWAALGSLVSFGLAFLFTFAIDIPVEQADLREGALQCIATEVDGVDTEQIQFSSIYLGKYGTDGVEGTWTIADPEAFGFVAFDGEHCVVHVEDCPSCAVKAAAPVSPELTPSPDQKSP